jgi:hypothetical protein
MLTHTTNELRGCRHWRCRLSIWLLDRVLSLASRLANSHGIWLNRRVMSLVPVVYLTQGIPLTPESERN